MGLGRQGEHQGKLFLAFDEIPRSRGHTLDRCGGMRRVWLRGRVNVQKLSLIHVAGFNLGLLMRAKIGCDTPRG